MDKQCFRYKCTVKGVVVNQDNHFLGQIQGNQMILPYFTAQNMGYQQNSYPAFFKEKMKQEANLDVVSTHFLRWEYEIEPSGNFQQIDMIYLFVCSNNGSQLNNKNYQWISTVKVQKLDQQSKFYQWIEYLQSGGTKYPLSTVSEEGYPPIIDRNTIIQQNNELKQQIQKLKQELNIDK